MQKLSQRPSEQRKFPRMVRALSEGIITISISAAIAACGGAATPHQSTTPQGETAVSGLRPQKLSESEVVLVRSGNMLKAAVLEFESGDTGPDRLALQECKTQFDNCVQSMTSVRPIKGAHVTFVTYTADGWKAVGQCEDVYANGTERMESAGGPLEVYFASCDISSVEKGRSIMVAFFPAKGQAIDTSDTTYQKQ
jgi:hypothetical protein